MASSSDAPPPPRSSLGSPLSPKSPLKAVLESTQNSASVISPCNKDSDTKLPPSSVPKEIPALNVPSYAQRFKSSLRNLRKISNPTFLEDGTHVVQAPEKILLQTSDLWKDHLVAHFHGRMPHQGKVFADLNPVWGKFGNITVRKVSDTCCLIYVPFVQTRDWVLEVGYWQAGNVAFSVFPWSSDGNLAAHELTSAPTWAILKNVPPQLYSLDGISVVASGIGEPLHTEKSRLDPYHFGDTKVKVEINLETNPPEAVEVRDSAGNSVRINVEYPRLPPKCLNCGRFGHLLNRCNRPLQKGRKFEAQKRTGGLAVVATSSDLIQTKTSSDEVQVCDSTILEVSENIQKEEKKKSSRSRSRARSRSERRARSRSRIRGLSSPPEVVGKAQLVSEKAVVASAEDASQMSVLEDKKSLDSDMVHSSEEGPMQETPIVQKVELEQKEDDSLWITKHSKAYRRALRQEALWKASTASFSPTRGMTLQPRGLSSGTKFRL